MRKLIQVLLLFVVAAAFVYAGGQSEASKSGAHSSKRVTLRFWWPDPQPNMTTVVRDDFVAKINADKSLKYRVQFTGIPFSGYFTKLDTAFASGTNLDLIGLGYGQMGQVASLGNLTALNPYLDKWSGFKDFYPAYRNIGTYNGKIYAMLLPEIRPLMYRKDLFKNAGISGPPTTMAQFAEDAKRIAGMRTKSGQTIDGMDVALNNSPEQLTVEYMSQFGALYLWSENGQINTSKGVVEGLQYLQRMVQEGLGHPYVSVQGQNSKFLLGLAGESLATTSWDIPKLDQTFGAQNVGIALPPSKKALVLGVFVAIPKNTAHMSYAVDLYKKFFSVENMWQMWKAGFVPGRKSMRSKFIAMNPSQNTVLAEALANGFGYRNGGHFFQVLKVIRPAIEKILLENANVKTTLDQAAQQIR